MATHKNAFIRYQTLDKCFSNPGRRYYIYDLVDACSKAIYEFSGIDDGIKRRQVLEDIRFMKSEQGWSIPLKHIRDGHKVYYRYEDLSFSINNQPLNVTEQNQLKEALLTLSRFKGMPQFEWVEEITARLDSGLGLSNHDRHIIEFEHNNYLKGLEFITPLYNATLYQRVLCISYKSFKSEEIKQFEFHPYYLKQFKNRWFAFGLNNDLKLLSNLALDRIESIYELNESFIQCEIDFSEYFEDVIGVTIKNDANTEKILLRVSNNLFPYIETKPLHGSQKIKERQVNYVLIEIEIIPNYEFESLILSFGEDIMVISPESIRDRINKRVKRLFENYGE